MPTARIFWLIVGMLPMIASMSASADILRIGIEDERPPYAFLERDVAVGFDIDLFQALGRVMGFRPEFHLGNSATTREHFLAGDLEVLGNAGYGDKRTLQAVLSAPLGWIAPGVISRQTRPRRSLAALANQDVLVVSNDPVQGMLEQFEPTARVVPMPDVAEAMRQVAAGRYDAAIVGDVDQARAIITALGLAGGLGGLTAQSLETGGQVVFAAVSTGHADVATRLSTGLAILRTNGEYQRLHARWFETPPQPGHGDDPMAMTAAVLAITALLGGLATLGWCLRTRQPIALPRGPSLTGQELLDALPVGIYRSTPDGRFIEVNLALATMLGYPDRESLLAAPNTALYVNLDVREHWVELMRSGAMVRNFDFQARRANGDMLWVSNTAHAVRNANGRITGYQGYFEDISERRRAEQALGHELEISNARVATSERLFHEIFRSAGNAILLLDDSGLFDCNDRALELFGYTDAKTIAGHHFGQLSPPVQSDAQSSMEAASARFAEARRLGTVQFEWLHRRRNGDVFPSEVLLSAFDLSGRTAFQATIRDISARKWTEAALRDSERRMADIINLLPDPTLVIDQTGRIQFWNRALEDLTGVRADQMLGRGDYEYAIPFYGERRPILIDIVRLPEHQIEACYTHVRRQNDTLVGESYVPHLRDGGVYVIGTAAPLFDSRGEYVGAIEIIRDITERRQAEEALEDSERRLSHIIDFLPDATVVIDKAGKIITWNKAMAEMTGVSAERMLGRGDFEAALPFFGERRPMLMDLLLKPDPTWESAYTVFEHHGDSLYGEVYASALRGRQIYVMGSASILRDAKGHAMGAIELIHDLTERKRLEMVMHEAKEAAESATRAKSEFLANMSHEIRTPMNAIIGMTSLLLNTALTAEQRDLTETTQMSGEALLALINDILDFSKIEAGHMDMEAQPFDLRQCLESAVDLVAVKAGEKGLELACLIEENAPPTLIGDVTRLRQILVNLLNNAIKFTETGEVVARVTVEANAKDESDGVMTLRFSVRDTGIGIPANRMDRLFKSFSQVDASTTRRYGGTGLGLAISARLAEMMGGRMWVESAGIAGQGATFHFTLCLPVSFESVEQALPDDLPELAGKRVMIVDDNPTNGLILTRQTEGWGMIAETFEQPEEALETIRQGVSFDLAILDMQMPDMDGIQLARGIRQSRDPNALPLIMLTSLGRRDPAADEVGFAAFLNKPIKSAALHDALRLALGSHRGPLNRPRSLTDAEIDTGLAVRHPLHILVAEDYVINQKVALYTLGRMGYRADLATNGLEVLEALRRQRYDVILMDVQMPEMDGLEATRRIIAEWNPETAGGPRPRIVAMTANAMSQDREICLAAGMDDYVTKPILVARLQEALLQCPVGTSPTPNGGATPPAIDRATLLEFFPDLASGEDGVFREMVGMLLEDVPMRLDSLETAASQNDPEGVRAILHTLKSAGRSFGALPFAELCQTLETQAKTGTLPPDVDAAVTTLRLEFARVAEEISHELRC